MPGQKVVLLCIAEWLPALSACDNGYKMILGAVPGGGALVSCSTSTPINHIVFFCCAIPVVLENRRSSQGGGGVRTPCTLPLDPPLTPHAINLLKTIFWFKFQKIKSKARSNQNPENMIYVKGLIFWGSQALVWISAIGGYFIYFRSMCLIESPSLDVLECKVRSKQKRLSAFFVHHYTNKKLQKRPQQMMTELSIDWPKMKLPKRTFQQSWLEKYKWLKFDPPKGMFCLLCQKANLKSISCE